MESTPLFDRRVYASDTKPDDERDGVIWVDTSVSPRDTFVYSTDTNSWEKVSAESWKIQNTAPSNPSDGDGWIDTSVTPPEAKVYEADDSTWYNVDTDTTDHGALTGLGDDDHPQYVKDSVNPSDVTGSRSPGTWYQNNTGNPLLVYVLVNSTGSGTATCAVHVNSSQTNRQITGNTRSSSNTPVGSVVWVPDGMYYKVTGNTNFNLQGWFEAELQ